MTPSSFLIGAPPAALDIIENEKAPSVAGGAQKIPVRDISARETSSNHPLKVDSKIREAHIMAVRSKSRMTILVKCSVLFTMRATDWKGRPVAGMRIMVNSIVCRTVAP